MLKRLYWLFLGSSDRLFGVAPGKLARRIHRATGAPEGSTSKEVTETGSGSAPDQVAAAPAVARSASRDAKRPDDAQVREWKAHWVKGAESRWAGSALVTNPHKPGSSRAAAWRAGWHWAELQPDRRQTNVVLLAHEYRRKTDTSARLVRSAQAGAVGLSMLTIAGWLWRTRRQRSRRELGP
jgi:hypothetical protein